MKLATLICALITCTQPPSAEAGVSDLLRNLAGTKGNLVADQENENKLMLRFKRFLEKKNACDLAIGFVHKEEKLEYEALRCVADLTLNAGTVNEKRGCAFRTYLPEKDSYVTYDRNGWSTALPDTFVAGESCGSGGFEKLIEYEIALNSTCKGPKVADCLMTSQIADMQPVLLFANRSKYVEWISSRKGK